MGGCYVASLVMKSPGIKPTLLTKCVFGLRVEKHKGCALLKTVSRRRKGAKNSAGPLCPTEGHATNVTLSRYDGGADPFDYLNYLSKTFAGKSNFSIRSSSAYDKMTVFLPCDFMG